MSAPLNDGFRLTLFRPLPSDEQLVELDIDGDVDDIVIRTSLPGGFDTMRVTLRTDAAGVIAWRRPEVVEPTNVLPWARVELTRGMTLVWEGRVADFTWPGDVTWFECDGYKAALHDDFYSSTDVALDEAGAVVQAVVSQAAPQIAVSGVEWFETLVEHAPRDFDGVYPDEALNQYTREGGVDGLLDWFVYDNRVLCVCPRVPPDVPHYSVPVDGTITGRRSYRATVTSGATAYTSAVDNAESRTDNESDLAAVERYGVRRVGLFRGGNLSDEAAETHRDAALLTRVNPAVSASVRRDALRGMETAGGWEVPYYLVRAGQWAQVGAEAPQVIVSTTASLKSRTATYELGEPVRSITNTVAQLRRMTQDLLQRRDPLTGAKYLFSNGRTVVNVRDFGARGDGETDDTVAIQAAIDYAKALGVSALGASVLFPPGRYLLTEPLVLPRTGATPTNVIWLTGANQKTCTLIGDATFPTGRGMIEWEDTVARCWEQGIHRLTFRLPDVAQVRAIRYAISGCTIGANEDAGGCHWNPVLTGGANDWVNEKFHINMSDVLIEASNTYHDYLIDIEGWVSQPTFINVNGDPTPGATPTYDTCLFRFTYQDGYRSGAAESFPNTDLKPVLGNDQPGCAYGTFINCWAMIRRGGWARFVEGRMTQCKGDRIWSHGGDDGPVWDLLYSTRNVFEGIGFEGQADRGGQLKLTEGYDNVFGTVTLGRGEAAHYDATTWVASTAYALNDRVIPTPAGSTRNIVLRCSQAGTSGGTEPTWNTGGTTVDNTARWVIYQAAPAFGPGIKLVNSHRNDFKRVPFLPGSGLWSNLGQHILDIDADSSHNTFPHLELPNGGSSAVPGSAGGDGDAMNIQATNDKQNWIRVTTNKQSNPPLGTATDWDGDDYEYGSHPHAGTTTVALDFPSIAVADHEDLTVTVYGAAVGDSAYASPTTTLEAGLIYGGAWVSDVDEVTVRLANITGSPIDPASRSWTVKVFKRTRT